ncbi:hypothetical protein ACFFJJ_10155 [Fictibacillus phosphorivorans]
MDECLWHVVGNEGVVEVGAEDKDCGVGLTFFSLSMLIFFTEIKEKFLVLGAYFGWFTLLTEGVPTVSRYVSCVFPDTLTS